MIVSSLLSLLTSRKMKELMKLTCSFSRRIKFPKTNNSEVSAVSSSRTSTLNLQLILDNYFAG